MKQPALQEIIIALLILLFVYTGLSKILDWQAFEAGIRAQPFPNWLSSVVIYTLPYLEIIISVALFFDKARKTALYAYGILITIFTLYCGLIIFNFFDQKPCVCGGIVSQLSWKGHFIINCIFLLLVIIALALNHRINLFMHKQGVS